MEKLQTILLKSILNAQKVGTLISILLFFCIGISFEKINPGGKWYVTFLICCALVAGLKFIFGGWNSSSLKGMTWSCILSTIAGVGLAITGMKTGGHSISFWMCCLPIGLGLGLGIWAYKWLEEMLTDIQVDEFSLDDTVDSIFKNGLSNTWNALTDDLMGDVYLAASKGVAVYANVVFITGFILFLLYR